ncbi:MAG: AAA family ATPase [Actinomycetota bacterium]
MEPIGRAAECAVIAGFLDDLQLGRGGVLLVEGDGGTGKTTLAGWALARAESLGMITLSGRSWERAQSVPYEAIVAALGRLLRATDDEHRQTLVHGLSSLAQLFDGLGLEPVEPSIDSGRARLHDAIATLLSRLAVGRPVLFHIDDLHWTDATSLEAIQFLCRDLPYVQLGLLATSRPNDADARPEVRRLISSLRRADVTKSIVVRDLDRDQTVSVVRSRLPGTVTDRVLEFVWSRSAGTPLVIHELIDDLIDRGVLVEGTGRWRLTEHDPAPPEVLSELIVDRLDQLTAEPRRLLEVLAVADTSIGLEVLERVTGLERDDVVDGMATLRDRRLVRQAIDERSSVEWYPDHPIISNVVAAQLDELVRQRIHRQLLAADSGATTARQARYIIGAGKPDDPMHAIETLLRAADEAARAGATPEAIAFGEAAGRMLSPELEYDDERRFRREIDARLGIWQLRTEDLDQSVAQLTRAWDGFFEAGDVRRVIDIHRDLDRADFHRTHTSEQELEQRLDRLIAAVREFDDLDLLLDVLYLDFQTYRRVSHSILGKTDLAREVVTLAERIGTPKAEVIAAIVATGLRWLNGAGDALPEGAIANLLTLAQSEIAWHHRNRALVTVVDEASLLGRRAEIESSLALLRDNEREVGEPPNWRHVMLRGWFDVQADCSTEMAQAFGSSPFHGRVRPFLALHEACATRYRLGPTAGLAHFNAVVGDGDFDDFIGRTSVDLGRLFLARGLPEERDCAAAALEAVDGTGSVGFFALLHGGVFQATALRAVALAGFPATGRLRAEWREYSDGRGWLMAAVHESDAAIAPDPGAAAAALVHAADLYRSDGLDLLAVDRYADAGELSAGSIDGHRLAWAVDVTAGCGADWLRERIAGLGAKPASARPVASHDESGLTRREWEVATEVAKGLTNREVAAELFISIRTVTSHLDHIYTKLGISSRKELTDHMVRDGRS